MKPKTIPLYPDTGSIPLKHQGYIGLQIAQQQIHKVLREMTCGTPIRFQFHASDSETVIVLIGNGICATLHVQPLRIEKKGGRG